MANILYSPSNFLAKQHMIVRVGATRLHIVTVWQIHCHCHCHAIMLRLLRQNAANAEQQCQSRPARSSDQNQRARTEKARAQKLVNAKEKKLRQELDPEFNASLKAKMSTSRDTSSRDTYSAHLQHWFFTPAFFSATQQEDAYSHYGSFAQDRARCVYSLILALVSLLKCFFGSGNDAVGNNQKTCHVLNTHIVDDTSTRVRGPSHTDATTVYTIMNSIQTVHARRCGHGLERDPAHCDSFRVPTPLTILDQANTEGIHKAFTASALVTAKGIGEMFQNFGLPANIVQAAHKTFVFVGDSLRANDAAFQEEAKQISQQDDMNHLALRIRCTVHQLGLIRKPAVLFIPRLWSTVVRLSHLFEGLTFRKSFAKALAKVIANSFVYLQVHELPDQSRTWKLLSDDLRASFRCRSKIRRENFDQMLDFLNGDLDSESVIHYCVDSPDGCCCSNEAEALAKCLQLAVRFFARGYPPPLLYRFKHFDEAVSFVTAGTCIHKLLTQALATMGLGDVLDSKLQVLVDKLLSDVDIQAAGTDDTDAACFVDDNDVGFDSYQAQNAKRKQLVHQEITKPGFGQSALIVDFIIRPIDGMINRLFRRSARLSKLTLLGTRYSGWEEDAEKSRSLFLELVSGQFGWQCIDKYCALISGGMEPVHRMGLGSQHFKTLFVLAVHLISDMWRRLVHEHSTPQFQILKLAGMTLEQFVLQWDRLISQRQQCQNCFDSCFSMKVLNICGELAGEPHDVQNRVFSEMMTILTDIATFAPVSSDPVEVKNGQVQSVASRRGNMAVKGPKSAKESSFLQSAIRDHELAKHWVESQVLPTKAKVSGILRRAGMTGSNQHSQQKDSWLLAFLAFHAMLCFFCNFVWMQQQIQFQQ